MERYTGIPVMTLHRTIESQLDCPALKAKQSRPAVLACLKCHAKSQPVDIKRLRNCHVVAWENGNRPFHGFLSVTPTVEENKRVSRVL